MAELRSRSPRAGLETAENGTTKEEQIRKDLEDLKNLVHMQGGRINTLDQRSAHTRDQVQKQQQLEASKQAIVTSWPDQTAYKQWNKWWTNMPASRANTPALQHSEPKPDGLNSALLNFSQKKAAMTSST